VHGKEDAAAEGIEALFNKPFVEDDVLDVIKRLTGVQEHDVGWTVSLHVVLDGLLQDEAALSGGTFPLKAKLEE
jgi:hypothetical protein